MVGYCITAGGWPMSKPLCTGPFKNFPQITVYHPQPGSGYAFANIGWTGWIGSITG